MNVKNNQDCVLMLFLQNPKASLQAMNYFHIKMVLFPVLLMVCTSGCGCLLGGGGDTARADRLQYLHKEAGIGIGGPGWWVIKQIGARLVREDEPVAALIIQGVNSIQVSKYALEMPSDARRVEILRLYAGIMHDRDWHLISRVHEGQQVSCVYVQYDEDRFRGIFVIAIEGEEMNVIKVVGNIHPEAFAELNANLGHHGVRLPAAK